MTTLRDREITWHHGPGSWVGLDRDAGTGVAILSATPVSVDGAGLSLLASP